MIAPVSQSGLSDQSSFPVSGVRNTFCGVCRLLLLLLKSLSKFKSPSFFSGFVMSLVNLTYVSRRGKCGSHPKKEAARRFPTITV
jgi:hypothetical protein